MGYDSFEDLVALGFFPGVLAFLPVLPLDTPIWLRYSVLFVLNAKVSSFALIFNFIIPDATSMVAPAVLKNGLPKNIHFKYHKIHVGGP
jgi:hypothetical protein